MGVLEVTRRRLKEGVTPTDPALQKILPKVREAAKTDYVYRSGMEDPSLIFIFATWSSLDAYNTFTGSSEGKAALAPLDELSSVDWTEHMPFDHPMSVLPSAAPCMSVSRCFLKAGEEHPKEYFRKIADLQAPIEKDTDPWLVVNGWTVDTVPGGQHKWLMMVGWRSKKHHREYAQWLRTTAKDRYPEFPGIPDHYDPATVHAHTWDLERPEEREAASETIEF